MVEQANPFTAMGQSFNALQGAWDQRTRNQAGRAYASGDRQGAANALAQGGMSEEAASLEYRGQQREALISAEERRAAEMTTTAMLRGVEALKGVPYEQRNQYFEQMAPVLAQVLPPEVIENLRGADKSDQALGMFGTALGAEAERLQLFQQANGGDIVGVSQTTGRERSRIQGPGPAPQAPPTGYRNLPDGSMEAIPGGPADTSVVARRAAAGRAPPRGRSGGGSRGGSSSGAPAAAATPSRRPWERF